MGRSKGKGDKRGKDKGDVKEEIIREKKPSVFERLSSPRENFGEERAVTREDVRQRERDRNVDADAAGKRRGEASDKDADRPRKRPAIVWEPRPVRTDDQQDNPPHKEREAPAAKEPTPVRAEPVTVAPEKGRGGSMERSRPEGEDIHYRKDKDSRRESRSERQDTARERDSQAGKSQEKEKSREDDRGGGKPALPSSSGREQREKGDKSEKDRDTSGKDKDRSKGRKEREKSRQDVDGGQGGPTSSRRETDRERDKDREKDRHRDKDKERERDREYDDRAACRYEREHESKEREDRGTRDRDKQGDREAGDRDRARERDRDRDIRRNDHDKADRDLDVHLRDRIMDMPDITPLPDGRVMDPGSASPPAPGMPMPNITRPTGGAPMVLMMHSAKDYHQPPPPPPRHQPEGFTLGVQGMHHSERPLAGDMAGGGGMGMGLQHLEHTGGGAGGSGLQPPFGPMVSARVGFDGSGGGRAPGPPRGSRQFYDEHPDEHSRPIHPMPPLTAGGQVALSYAPDPTTTYLDGGSSMSPHQGLGPGMRAPGGDNSGSRHGGTGPRGGQQLLIMPPIMDMGMGVCNGMGVGMSTAQQQQQPPQQQQQQPTRMMGSLGANGVGPVGPDGAMASDGLLANMDSGGGAGVLRRGHLPPGAQRNGDLGPQGGPGGQAPGFTLSAYASGTLVAADGGGGPPRHFHQQQQQTVPTPAKDPLTQMRMRREYCRQRAQLEDIMAYEQVVGQEAYGELQRAVKRINAEVVLLPLAAHPSMSSEPRPATLAATTVHVPAMSFSSLSTRMRCFALAELLLDDAYWSSAHMAATLAAASSAAGGGSGVSRSAPPGLGSEEHQPIYSQGLRACLLFQEKSSALPWCRSGKGGMFLLTEAQQTQGLF